MTRRTPEDPEEWLARARSSLLRARSRLEGVFLEDLCFDAQQSAEKAIKAVCVHARIGFPYVHHLERLLTLLAESGIHVPDEVWQARELTIYAVEARYPSVGLEVTEEQYRDAIDLAEATVLWAENAISQK